MVSSWATYITCWMALVAAFMPQSIAQNRPPQWDPTSLDPLDSIPEDTPLGTTITTLRCTDQDGDIIVYKKESAESFKVDRRGVVTLVKQLDFESGNAVGVDVSFACIDVFPNGTAKSAEWRQTRYKYSVSDANDNKPEFTTQSDEGYIYKISEDIQVGTPLTPALTILDKDFSSEFQLKELYFICDPTKSSQDVLDALEEPDRRTCDKFRVDFEQGSGNSKFIATVYTTASLDFETQIIYQSELIAVDGTASNKLTSSILILLEVEDAQDTPPVFTNRGASTEVPEDIPVNTALNFSILARDGDVGAKRPVKIEIIRDDNDVFSLAPTELVNADTGVYASRIVIKNKLDREKTAIDTFVVKVTELDNNVPTLATATATYSIFVSDVNDNKPTFKPSIYDVNVTEFTNTDINEYQPVQIAGLRISCEDDDEPSNSQYNVRIVSQTFPSAYSISPAGTTFTGRGSIFLQVDDPRYLDYDILQNREQTVVLEAREIKTTQVFSSSATVFLHLVDVNDNTPQFDRSNYNLFVSEIVATDPPYLLANLTATDSDSGDNGRLTYRLETGTSPKFSINSGTGELFLVEPVDYETNQQYVFLVYVSDMAAQPKSSQTEVTVNVENFNDEGPKFKQSRYQTSAYESSKTFLNPVTVVAEDDEDPDAKIAYSIVAGQSENNAFSIGRETGKLSLVEFLDYQQTPSDSSGNKLGFFTLKVQASDQGVPPQTNTVDVIVNVIDENNHPPVLKPEFYEATISEIEPPGTVIADINGTDNDAGSFGEITYRPGPGSSGNFRVDPVTGQVSVGNENNFDFDTTKTFSLIIIATDGGAPQRTATANVFVTLTDANNKPPVFKKFLYRETVNQTAEIGSVVLRAEASDADSNSSLVYSIDRSSYEASDGDGNILSINNRYNYDFRDAFRIDNNGTIRVNGKLNKEYAQEISFRIFVRDVFSQTGPQIADTRITIIIEGEPNRDIYFEPVGIAFLNEDEKPGYIVSTFNARDRLTDELVKNYIKLPGSSEFMNVDGVTGRVELAKSVDRESGIIQHRVIVKATSDDGTRSATSTLTVSILDVNDNSPKFQRSAYFAEVAESAIFPDFVQRILATDEDSASFGPVTYRISGGLDADDFDIFQAPGNAAAEVIVAEGAKLDYNKRPEYVLTIVAEDNPGLVASSTQRKSLVSLTIRVLDENNHIPYFKDDSPKYAVPQTAEIGTNFALIQAFDDDGSQGPNGQITYSLEPGSSGSGLEAMTLFGISPSGGNIFVANSLLNVGGSTFVFNVRAKDKGERPNSSTLQVTVQVFSSEDNDGKPRWISPPEGFIIYAQEETTGEELDFQFRVDPLTGNKITYSLSPNSDSYEAFKINEDTGVITIIKALDREIKESYQLLVYAQDVNDTDKLRTGRIFVLMLTDLNDNNANFMNPRNYPACGSAIERPQVVPVLENTPANRSVYRLTGCDPDGPGNNEVDYRFYTEDPYCAEQMQSSIFEIRGDQLYTTQIVDYEQQREYNLCIRVSSRTPTSGSVRRKREFDLTQVDVSLLDVAFLSIQVVDVNDHGPEFPSPTAVAVVPFSPGNGPVHMLDAVDKDGKGFNTTVYRIDRSVFYPADGNPVLVQEAFELRGNTRAVFPKLPSYIMYKGGHFELLVTAIDSTDSTMKDEQFLSIYVYERGQTMKLVLNLEPDDGQDLAESLIAELDTKSTKYLMSYISASESRVQNGVNLQKTDVCFVVVDSTSKKVLDIRQVISVLNQEAYQDVLKVTKYAVEDRAKCYPSRSSEDDVEWDDLWWVLVAVAIFLFVCCVICIIVVAVLYKNYKRYMDTRKTYLVQQ